MGKTNKAQRTKGNARPSNSSHSAQLLSLSGKTINGFIGFDGLEKDKASYVPVTGQQVSESCDSCVDSDFRMVMRKMLKRDAVTRLKAVQEFSDYCDEKDVDAVKNVLPFWPRLFNKLALDTDRRIREATHQANGKIISKVKRDIAPYLKSIMGVWLLGQCDLYAPAASAAQATFSNTFPTTKQSDAIAHCRSEIFNYFKDNLFEQTAKTLSDPSFTSSEDMENKYILVISGTLQALKLLLTIIQSRDHINLKDDFYSIVAENKFWKFAKSKEALVRGSWFALISSLAQTMHDVFNEMENKLTTTVLGSLSESDPIVAPSVWEAVLSIVVNFENCWQSININKLVLPQLWSLLKDGGKGNAQILFPCLLPFMSKLPSSIIEDEKFLLRFFSSLKESLFLDSVKLSHMECDAILTAFMECLQYICCVRLNKIDVCCSLLEKVLLNEVIPMVESSLYSRDTHLAVSKFYPLLGSLIHKLENECSARKDACEAFSKVIILFWNNLLPVTCNVFSLKGQKKIEATLYLSYFYNSMIVPSDVLIKSEKSKVKFEDEESQTDKQCQDYSVISKAINFSSLSLSNKKALSFTYIVKFSQCLCENITEEFDLYYLNLLTEVLGSAQTGEIFKELIITMCTVESEKEQLTEFLKQFILKWIEQVGKDISKLNSIVELVFIICSYFSENEALSILNLCCEVKNCALLQCLLCKGLKKHSNIMRDWLKNPVFASNLVIDIQEIMKKVIHDTSTEANDCNILLNILDTCFTAKVTEKSIINNKNLEAILDALKCFAEEIFTLDIENSNVQGGLNFLCDVSICILKNSKVCWNFRTMDDFISLIFNQSLRSNYLFQYLSKVWITALKSYISIKAEIIHDNSIILKMATKLHSAILSSITIDESTHVLNHCFGLLSAVQESLILQKAKLQYSALFALYKLMDTILPTDKNWLDLKEGLTLGTASLFLKKQLFYPLLIDETFHTNENKIQKLSVVCYTVSRIIIQELYRANTLADKTFFEAYIVKHLPQILWLASLCEGNCAASMLPEKLSVAIIEQDCVKILSFLSNGLSEIISDIYDSLRFSCTDWALPFRLFLQFCNLIHPQSISDLIKEMVEKMNQTETMNKYMLHQIVIPHLSEEKQLFYLKTSLLEISQMRDLSNEDYAGKLAEICCYLQNNNIFMTRDMQDIIIEAIIKVIEYEFEDENLEFTYNIQITAILSSMLKYGISAFTQNILNYCMDTLKNYLKAGYLVELKNPKSSLELYEMSTIFTILSHLKSYQDSSNSKSNLELPVFDDKFYKQMIFLYIYIANTINQFKPLPEMCSNVLSSISEAMEFLPSESLVKTIDECHELPGINTNSVFQSLISSLTFGVRQIQFISHFLLLKIMKHLPDSLQNIQKLQTDDDKDDDIGKIPLCLTPMVNLLTFLTEIVESMLSDFKIGDLCVVLPETDAYIYTMAYLLSWIEMLEFISSSPSQVRSIYAAHLEETALMSQLFSNVFRLMPCNPMLCLKKGLNVDTPKKEDLKLLFITPPIFNSDSPSPEEIQSVASYVFATSLRKVPASIRTWWNNLDRKSSDIVNKFTTKYISGLLCIEEIQAVHESEKQFENMVVQARPGSREVIATYTIDDCAIELGVQLPINYPLGPISAERRGKIVIGEMEWRHWLKQLTTVLRYQNGSILDGLNIWKRNLDKKFEGVEECMICYYILHSSTLKLPKLSCRICKKKFHSACLYKWFETSYNSTCPLCRNEFCIPM